MDHELYEKGASSPYSGTLFENTDYVVRFKQGLSNDQKGGLQFNYGSCLKPIHSEVYTLNFGNFIGETVFCGKTYRVESRKISKNQLDHMIQFISQKMASLPYQATSPTKLKVKSDTEWTAIFYHLWNQLRQALLVEWEGATLEDWWVLIEREPHHRLRSQIVLKPFWHSKQVDVRDMNRVIQHPENWNRLHNKHPLAQTALAQKLTIGGDKHFPSEVWQEEKNISNDTAENRMIKQILSECHEITLQMERRLTKKRFFNHLQLQADNRTLRQLIEYLMQSEWLQEVRELTHVPASSTILQYKNGYRQWYAFYQQILLGSTYPLSHEDINALVEGRNIATIFEYWCYFVIVHIIEQITGSRPRSFKKDIDEDGLSGLKEGLKVTFLIADDERIDVFYNKTFSGGKGSYSQRYRPDISLRWKKEWHHFDAKFKYQMHDADEFIESDISAKKEDIDKMHAYKDAIVGTKTAWVLFPKEKVDEDRQFFPDPRDSSGQCGTGAIGIMPGQLKALVKLLVEIVKA